MKYSICAILLIIANYFLYPQTGYYFVTFKDKNFNQYSLNNPIEFLSQRSLDRRTKQNISIDSLDLPVSKYYVDKVKSLGINVHFESKWLNGIMVKIEQPYLLDSLNNLPFVKNITYTRPLNTTISKINKFENQKDYIYGMASNQISMLKGDFLHQNGFDGKNILIAVLDAGFLGTDSIKQLDSLRNQNRIVLTRDFVDGNNDTYVYEKHSHGTYVLSTMAIIDNGNYVGTAPHAKYALIRTEDGATEYIFEEYCWVAGAELADSIGADLINSSLGYTVFDDPLMNHDWSQLNGKTSVASRAATIAARKGIICSISAGNWGSDTWRKIGVPADADSVLTVGAVDSQGNYAFFSSQGYTADGRVKPDVCAQGLGVATATSSGIYSTASGTSFSSPILCGVTACLLQAFPTKSNMEIIEAIKKSAHQYLYPDSLLGYGIPNFQLAYYILTNIGLNNVDESLFSLSPNPTTDFLNVTFNVPLFSSVQYQIFDTNCKILKEETILISNKKNIIIDVSNFKAGIYLLKVVLNEKQFSKIFVKLL